MDRKLLKFSLVCATGALLLSANPQSAFGYEEGIAGFTHDILTTEINTTQGGIKSASVDGIPMPGFSNIGIANVDTNLLIRSGPGENDKIIGKLPKDGGCDIIEKDNGSGRTKIKSGGITGYVKTDYLITGTEASQLALKVGNFIATSNTDGLNVRKSTNMDAEVVDQIAKGEELIVIDACVTTYGQEVNTWVAVSLSGDDGEEDTYYVAKQYVDLSYSLKKAVSTEETSGSTTTGSTRSKLISYAKQFVGNPYRFGGTSLTNGIDCSAFVRAVYAKYDMSLPRTSREQARKGTTISEGSLQTGDLVFYGSKSYINHVAIYIGNGKIVHASNKRDGIKISNMKYRQPVKYVRYIKG